MKELTYEEALKELEGLMRDLQAEQVSIDDLSNKSERAASLIQYCRQKLRDLETKLETAEGKPNQ